MTLRLFFNGLLQPSDSRGARPVPEPRTLSPAQRWWPVITAAAVVAVYLPINRYSFAFSDDYAYLVIRAYRAVNPYFLGDGRPIGGFLAHLLFSAVRRVPDTWILRLIGLAQLAIVLMLIQRAAILNRVPVAIAALLAISFASVAPVQNWVVWGVSAWQMPSLVCSIASFFWARDAVDEAGRLSKRNLACFFVLNFVALSIYQPFATAVCALILIEMLANRDRPFGARRWLAVSAAYAAALAGHFATFKLVYLSFVPPARQYRVGLVSWQDLPAKLEWFLTGPVKAAFAPGFTYPPTAFCGAMVVLALIGLWLLSRSLRVFINSLALCIFTLVVAHLPSLLPAENTPTRAQVSIALVGASIICLAIHAITQRLRMSDRRIAVLVACVMLPVMLGAGWRVLTVTARPQAIEFIRIARKLAETPLPDQGKLLAIGLPEGTSLVGSYCDFRAMIGCVSSSWQFGLPNMVRLWMRSQGIDDKLYQVYYMRSDTDTTAVLFEDDLTTYGPVPIDAYVIDFRPTIMQPPI